MAMERKASQIQEADLADKEDRASMSVKTTLRDPEYRGKILRWISVPIGMLNLGIIDSQCDATLLDLQILTSTDEEMAGLFFTSYNLGYTLGTLLGGFLYGKINSNLLLTLCCVLAGGSTIATPYCDTFLLMFISRCIVGFFLGIVLCIANAEHMYIWATEGESLLQLINCTYALGGIIGPAMASPFITERDDDNKTSSHQNVKSGIFINYTMTFNNSINYTVACNNFTYANITTDTFINNSLTLENFMNLTLECLNHTEANNSDLPRSTNVHYAYLIGGLISVLAGIQFLLTHIAFNKSSAHAEERTDSNVPERKLPLLLTVFLAGLLFLYFLFYCSIEVTFSSYLLVFIVKHFNSIGTHEAAYIITYYWAVFAAGRFISIFTSKYICPRNLVCIHLSMIASAIAGLIASALCQRFDVLTVFACLMGLACSATYAAAMSWTEAELMKVTGPISAVILVGSSIGAMVTPFVVGDLMENVSNMWFFYSIVVVLVLAASVLTIMMTFNKCYVNRKYGKLGAVIVQEKPLDIPDIVPTTHF